MMLYCGWKRGGAGDLTLKSFSDSGCDCARGGVALLLAFWLLLALAYSIPSSWMAKNIGESASILAAEPLRPATYADITAGGQYDNFTVYYMLDLATCESSDALRDALESKIYWDADFALALEKAREGATNSNYARYWHGYLVFLKPLLVIFNIRQMRIIAQTVFCCLLVAFAGYLSRRKREGIAIGVLLTICFVLLGALQGAATLPVFSSLAISLLASLWMVHLSGKKLSAPGRLFTEPFALFCAFGVVGAVTVYLDFFDNPILTLCIPLTVYLLCASEGSSAFKSILKATICSGLGWFAGYAGLWVGKWLLAQLVTGLPVLSVALDQVGYRSGMSERAGQKSGALEAISANLNCIGFVKYVVLAAAVCAAICCVLQLVKTRRDPSAVKRVLLASMLGMVLVGFLPYLWYALISNHSIVHASLLTYRNQIGALFPWLLVVLEFVFVSWRQKGDREFEDVANKASASRVQGLRYGSNAGTETCRGQHAR